LKAKLTRLPAPEAQLTRLPAPEARLMAGRWQAGGGQVAGRAHIKSPSDFIT